VAAAADRPSPAGTESGSGTGTPTFAGGVAGGCKGVAVAVAVALLVAAREGPLSVQSREARVTRNAIARTTSASP
jgi:hypothetical protein